MTDAANPSPLRKRLLDTLRLESWPVALVDALATELERLDPRRPPPPRRGW